MKNLLRDLAYACGRERLQKGSFYPLPARLLVRRAVRRTVRAPLAAPRIVNIETTSDCNAACSYCYRTAGKRAPARMGMDVYKKLVDECAALGIRELRLNLYGEPLLDELLAERIRYAKAKGIANTGVFTNGSLLSAEKARELTAAGLDEICVSVDGARKATYERIRRGLEYEMVAGNLAGLLAMAVRPRVHLVFTASPDNEDEIGLFRRQWEGKADSINIGSRYATGIREAARGRMAPCPYLWKRMFIRADGDVPLCCQDYDGTAVMGSVLTAGIDAIWRGRRFEECRRLHVAGESGGIPACGTCELNLWMRWLVPFRF